MSHLATTAKYRSPAFDCNEVYTTDPSPLCGSSRVEKKRSLISLDSRVLSQHTGYFSMCGARLVSGDVRPVIVD